MITTEKQVTMIHPTAGPIEKIFSYTWNNDKYASLDEAISAKEFEVEFVRNGN